MNAQVLSRLTKMSVLWELFSTILKMSEFCSAEAQQAAQTFSG
jgi:hypothetical protein